MASGIGKGITISSIGVLLKSMGFRVTSIKIDPYLNVDAGTMSPFEHGEVFVLKDGGEGDLDLGNYERFLDIELTKDHNITTGKVYQSVIARERRGDYLGKTVQVVPHITNEIQSWIERVSDDDDNDDRILASVRCPLNNNLNNNYNVFTSSWSLLLFFSLFSFSFSFSFFFLTKGCISSCRWNAWCT